LEALQDLFHRPSLVSEIQMIEVKINFSIFKEYQLIREEFLSSLSSFYEPLLHRNV